MLFSRIVKLCVISLALFNFTLTAEAKIPAKKSECSDVFRPTHEAEIQLGRNVFRLQLVPKSEQYLGIHLLTPDQRKKFFGEMGPATPMAKAIELMGRLPREMSGSDKAEIWNEIAQSTNCGKTPCLDSSMYLMDGPRYLFKGDADESLFIDYDGAVYGVHVNTLRDNGAWQPDYQRMRRYSH